MPPKTAVSTSATTTAMPRRAPEPKDRQVVYTTDPRESGRSTYTLEPHAPTPRDR